MSLRDIAQELAAQGFHVMPIAPAGKTPITKHGLKDASKEPAQIDRWFVKFQSANLGIRTGEVSGVFVLDRDDRHGGDKSLAELEALHGPLPPTVQSITGGGGGHYYFNYPGVPVSNRAGIRAGLDVRGDNGYVVAPPSIHATGKAYTWGEGHAPGEIAMADAPQWLLELVLLPSGAKGQSELELNEVDEPAAPGAQPDFSDDDALGRRAKAYIDSVPPAAEGKRNNEAFKLFGNLVALRDSKGRPLSPEVIFAYGCMWGERCTPPMSTKELDSCFDNCIHYGKLPAPKPPRPKAGSSTAANTAIPATTETKPGPTPSSLPIPLSDNDDPMSDRVTALVRTNKKIGALYFGTGKLKMPRSGKAPDTSNAGYDFAFLAALVAEGVTDKHELASAVMNRPDGHARKKGARYVRDTIDVVLEKCGPRELDPYGELKITKVVVFDSNPPVYELTSGDRTFRVTAEEISSVKKFRVAYLAALHHIPFFPSADEWSTWVNLLLDRAERCEMPPDASKEPALREAIETAIADLPITDDASEVQAGKSMDLGGGRIGFAEVAVRNRIKDDFPGIGRHDVSRVLKELGFQSGSHRIGEKVRRLWSRVDPNSARV